jgi:hypothetical protein
MANIPGFISGLIGQPVTAPAPASAHSSRAGAGGLPPVEAAIPVPTQLVQPNSAQPPRLGGGEDALLAGQPDAAVPLSEPQRAALNAAQSQAEFNMLYNELRRQAGEGRWVSLRGVTSRFAPKGA